MEQHLSLANKYRPSGWDSIVEQNEIKTILQNQIKNNNLKHAYLFCGSAGTGKTTSARIIANEMNKGVGKPIELDCASHNGVDDMRMIIEECKSRPIVGQYKIFVLDECFEGSSIVKTKNGNKKISELVVGDYVASMSGYNKVLGITKNKIYNDRLVEIKLSNEKIIRTTIDHLFFTDEGWIEAKRLVVGDYLYDYDNMCKLWQKENDKAQDTEVLLSSMFSSVSKEELQTYCKREDLCYLWERICREFNILQYKDLFISMQEYINIAVREDYNEFRIWDGVKEISIIKNESSKSNDGFKYCNKNVDYEEIKWDIKSTYKGERWQWTFYRTTTDVIQSIRKFMEVGICNTDTDKTKQQSNEISYIIQSRPWLCKIQNSSRGRWQRSPEEIYTTKRFKEENTTRRIRVESITFYKSRSDKQFRWCGSSYTEMYDLSVENSYSYFVENCLVHNCHMLTINAWNSLLKILEEPPEYVIFLFATTDPQKIIGTIMSRVQRFNFQRISVNGIYNRLKFIIESENKERVLANEPQITFDDSAIKYIARIAKGGMRESITTLEKCLDYSLNLSNENVTKITSGGVNEENLLDLTRLILNKKKKEAILKFSEIYMTGIDMVLFIKLYSDFLQNCLKYLITSVEDITNISQETLTWLKEHQNAQEPVYNLLESLLDVKSSFNSEDLKIILESWIIKVCR